MPSPLMKELDIHLWLENLYLNFTVTIQMGNDSRGFTWTPGFQQMVLFWEAVEPLGGGALLEKVCGWEWSLWITG